MSSEAILTAFTKCGEGHVMKRTIDDLKEVLNPILTQIERLSSKTDSKVRRKIIHIQPHAQSLHSLMRYFMNICRQKALRRSYQTRMVGSSLKWLRMV